MTRRGLFESLLIGWLLLALLWVLGWGIVAVVQAPWIVLLAVGWLLAAVGVGWPVRAWLIRRGWLRWWLP